MSFGEHCGFSEWSLSEEETGPFFAQAVELGITFWDTANVYQQGSSEEIVGKAIATYSRREMSCWPPSCTSRCTTVRAVPGCPGRR